MKAFHGFLYFFVVKQSGDKTCGFLSLFIVFNRATKSTDAFLSELWTFEVN